MIKVNNKKTPELVKKEGLIFGRSCEQLIYVK